MQSSSDGCAYVTDLLHFIHVILLIYFSYWFAYGGFLATAMLNGEAVQFLYFQLTRVRRERYTVIIADVLSASCSMMDGHQVRYC